MGNDIKEFKFVLSYENSQKNYGNGKGIHMTTRGDDFDETFTELKDRKEVMETLLQEVKQVKGNFVVLKTYTGESVMYDEKNHKYTDMKGNPLLSASQYAKQLKPPFPKDKVIPLIAKKYGVKEGTIDKMWEANGNISRTFGNAIHYAMEQWFRYKNDGCDEKEYHLPKHPFLREVVTSFPDKDKKIIPEVVISDVKHKMVGRADGLELLKDDYTIIDYKSDAGIKDNLKYHFMQLSFYATMLKNHGRKVDKVIVWNYVDKWVKYESEVLNIKEKIS